MHGTPHIVSDVMTHTVAAIGRKANFKEIVQLMEQWKVSALPCPGGRGPGDRRGLGGRSAPRRRSSATAIRTGTRSCGGSPISPRPAP